MTTLDVVEMVADWMAMSQEYGSICEDFAKNNIGPEKRWNFSPAKQELIYEIIQEMEKRLTFDYVSAPQL